MATKQAKVLAFMAKTTRILEYIICVFVVLGVILSIPDLYSYIGLILNSSTEISYQHFSSFLRHTLLLVAGIELIIMLISHSNKALLTLVLFVIARKMLVYAEGMLDILIGAAAIAVIFVILKFLLPDERLQVNLENTYMAEIPLDKLRNEYGISLSSDSGARTLAGIIYHLSKEKGVELENGARFVYGSYTLTVISVVEGVVKQVRVEHNDFS